MLRIKQAVVCLLCLTLSLTFWGVPAHAEDVEIIIDSVEVQKTGKGTIIGHCTKPDVGIYVSCMIGKTEMFNESNFLDNSIFDSCLMHIDQVTTGNNGTFLINFVLSPKWSSCEAKIMLGCTYGVNAYTTFIVPDIPSDLRIVQNNSVLYGREIFYVNGAYYTPDNISRALYRGENNICFFIGNNWYNLMSDKAIDNSFLVSDNASPVSEIEGIRPAYYYGMIEKIKLKWIKERVPFVESDFNINISGYVPKISGSIKVEEGKLLILQVLNKTDNTKIAEETITAEDGIFKLNYELPSLLRKKEYDISMVCIDNKNEELTNIFLNVDAEILTLKANGTADTADNVDIAMHVNTVTLGLFDEDISITGKSEISTSIPNLLASALLNLKATAYEEIETFGEGL